MSISDKPWGSIAQADYTPEQWRRACLVDTGDGAIDSRPRYLVPVREPNGDLNRAAVRAAAGGRGLAQVNDLTPQRQRSAARRLVTALRDLGEDPPSAIARMAGLAKEAPVEEPQPWSDSIMRTLPLEDVVPRRGAVTCERCGKDATGRMIDAYAAAFNVSAEIRDHHGHYNEVIDPTAFNRTIKNGFRAVGVYYHHGMTLHGTPSGEGAFPLGHPSVIRADAHGLFTATHYSTSDVGERALISIKEGTITGQSFSGRIFRSDPDRMPRRGRSGALPTVRRLELGLKEYGPTPTPAYNEAQILAARAAMGLTLPDRHSASGLADWAPPLPPDAELGAEDSREALSGRSRHRLRLRAEEHFRRAYRG